jgi:GNAT superfamily N-acetyltransferase
MEIRRASEADLAALVAVLGQRPFFSGRLADQAAGVGALLVAWVDGRPAGDVFLACGPDDVPEVRRHLPGVPRLVHLEVLGPLQRRGIGTALIRAGEAAARRLGHDRLALGVGLDNPGARRLYERLGYSAWGRGPVVATWREQRDDGSSVTSSETIDMLVKRL